MGITGATHRAVSLAGVTWIDSGRRTAFNAKHPGYGVEVIATGKILSKDGVTPSVWTAEVGRGDHRRACCGVGMERHPGRAHQQVAAGERTVNGNRLPAHEVERPAKEL